MNKSIPLEIIDQIGRHCPRAISCYVICLGRADADHNVVFRREEITTGLSESYCKFKNDLRALAREGLLEWHEMGYYLHVTLAEIDVTDV